VFDVKKTYLQNTTRYQAIESIHV